MELVRNADLASFTSIRIGGKASLLASVERPEDLRELILFARAENLPLFVLGGGSNTVFGDVRELVSLALREKLRDFYRLFGFPATVGGAVTMNAGAFGVEMADFLEAVTFMDWEGKIHRANSEEGGYWWRSCL